MLANLNGSWTYPSGRWDARAPFAGLGQAVAGGAAVMAAGRAILARFGTKKVLTAVGIGLGLSSILSAFSGDEDTWTDGDRFDERMAMMHQMWLKLNDRLSGQCPDFVQSAYINEYRNDRTRFAAFYSKTGKVTSRPTSYVGLTPSPSATEVGTAKAFWDTLIGWIAIAEKMCPGRIAPGLAEALEHEGSTVAGEGWTWQWWAVGGAAVLLGMAYLATKRGPQVIVGSGGMAGFQGLGSTKKKLKKPLTPEEYALKMRGAADRMRQNWLRTYGLQSLEW